MSRRLRNSAIVRKFIVSFADGWFGTIFARRDLEQDRFLLYGTALRYEKWCLSIDAEIRREEFEDSEIDPETKVLLRITFKTLGSLGNL